MFKFLFRKWSLPFFKQKCCISWTYLFRSSVDNYWTKKAADLTSTNSTLEPLCQSQFVSTKFNRINKNIVFNDLGPSVVHILPYFSLNLICNCFNGVPAKVKKYTLLRNSDIFCEAFVFIGRVASSIPAFCFSLFSPVIFCIAMEVENKCELFYYFGLYLIYIFCYLTLWD